MSTKIYLTTLRGELLNILTPVTVKTKSLVNNPRILKLQFKFINHFAGKVPTLLGTSVLNNVNRIHQNEAGYCGSQSQFLITKPLSSWDFLRDFKSKAGIYQFVIGSDSYIGSTKDIFKRCFIQHKNLAFTKPNKHKLFYKTVVENGWDKFILNIICVIPDHVILFSSLTDQKYPDFILNEKDLSILQDLTYYELTVAEQLNLDYYRPTLNTSLMANWSTYNVGSTGYIRKKEVNSKLSLSFLNRSFTDKTKELHKINNTGRKLSDLTKIKMSKSQGGVIVNLLDVNTNEIIVFKNKTLVAKELNISLRTVSRWINDGKIHSTHSLKYPKVKLTI